jgi:hypothetical protein
VFLEEAELPADQTVSIDDSFLEIRAATKGQADAGSRKTRISSFEKPVRLRSKFIFCSH